jgi:RimJ/RimL family protein N-acetyltransferase
MLNENVVLRGRRLTLVPYLPHHVPRYHEWMTDADLLAQTKSEPLSLEEEVSNQVSWLVADDKLTFIILAPMDPTAAAANAAVGGGALTMIGDCNVFLAPQEPDEAEVEVALAEKSHRGRGFAAEAVELLMTYVARAVGKRRFVAKIADDNAASIALFTSKLGFALFKEVKVFSEVHLCRDLADGDAALPAAVYTTEAYAAGVTEAGVRLATWSEYVAQISPQSATAPKDCAAGETVAVVSSVRECSTVGAVCVESADASVNGALLLHSCDPACILIQDKLVAVRPLRAGDALNVNLSLSYSALALPFPAQAFCAHARPAAGAAASVFGDDCQGIVAGFRALPELLKQRWISFADAPVRVTAYGAGFLPASTSANVVVAPNGDFGHSTFAASAIAAGDLVYHAVGATLPFPTVYTLCVSEAKHLLFAPDGQCLAHLCDPNVAIVVDEAKGEFRAVALRPIAAGELIGFNYLTTEWSMDEAFPCACGAAGCFREIKGFKHLAEAHRAQLLPLATPVIRRLAAK